MFTIYMCSVTPVCVLEYAEKHILAVSGGRVDCALKSFVEAGGSPQMDK